MTSDAVVTSESLHNKNCYAYLHLVHLPTSIRHTLPATMVEDLTHCRNTYRSRFAYADLYSAFYQYMDEHIQELYTAHPEATAELDRCVLSMFINDNHNLSRTFNAIKHIPLTHTTFKTDIEDSISYYISDGSVRINQAQSPADADTWCSRLYSILNNNYKPQYVTGLPSVRHYRANQGQPLTELRLGTQGQRHNGEPRVSPLFEAFLYAQARQNTNRNDVTHLYINNLNRDRTTYIGKKKRRLL
jgi:hypothetical protein